MNFFDATTHVTSQGELILNRKGTGAPSDKYVQLVTERNTLQTQLKDINKKLSGLQEELKSEQVENWRLLVQLHLAQELIEKLYIRQKHDKSQITIYRSRVDNWKKRFINTAEYGSLAVDFLPDQRWIWNFKDIYLSDKLIQDFRITTEVGQNGLLVWIHRDSETKQQPLVRWPDSATEGNVLDLSLDRNTNGLSKGKTLNTLALTDWNALKRLTGEMVTYARSYESRPEVATMLEALNEYHTTLAAWPTTLRYDTIQLESSGRDPNYRWLDIKISNVNISDVYLKEFRYRIASVDSSAEKFGTNPRLEFGTKSKQAFKRWYAESDDSRGQRLELRFAHPNAMDISVWHQLDQNDQLLITGIISTLKEQIFQLSKYRNEVDFDEWRVIPETLVGALTAYYYNLKSSLKI